MLTTSFCAPCSRIQVHRQRHTPYRPSPLLSTTKHLCHTVGISSLDQVGRRRNVEASVFVSFFGGLGCLPFLFAIPFLTAIFAVWSILATIQFVVVSTVLLSITAGAVLLVFPQARNAAKLLFSKDKDADAVTDGAKKRRNVVIDVEPDPEVKRGYDDLDDELRRFDEDLRNRRR